MALFWSPTRCSKSCLSFKGNIGCLCQQSHCFDYHSWSLPFACDNRWGLEHRLNGTERFASCLSPIFTMMVLHNVGITADAAQTQSSFFSLMDSPTASTIEALNMGCLDSMCPTFPGLLEKSLQRWGLKTWWQRTLQDFPCSPALPIEIYPLSLHSSGQDQIIRQQSE